MTTPVPSTPDVEFLRRRAKDLLRGVQAGDAEALRRARAALPRASGASDAQLAETLRLADAQHAVAREHGFESWSALRREVEARLPVEVRAERFLAAVRAGDGARAARLVGDRRELASADVRCAAVLGDARRLGAAIAKAPAAATAADAHGLPPLLYACASPAALRAHADARGLTRCVELLLDRGAEANTYLLLDPDDPKSRLPALYWACVADQPKAVRLLLERGADPNDGESIYHAAELNRRECLELLLAHGAEISKPHGTWGNTPLYFISAYSQGQAGVRAAVDGMRWLLEHGADPNVRTDPSGETPLHRIAERHSRSTAELLLDHGADPNLPRGDGRTPYALAVRAGNEEVAELFRQRGADASTVTVVDEFLGACLRGDAAGARERLASRPSLLDELSDEDRSALGRAAQEGREESVRLMVGLGFDPAYELDDGGTPLHWAAWHGRPGTVRVLLELGAPLEVRDSRFRATPLGWAAHGSANCRRADDDYCEVIDALLAAGAATDTIEGEEPPEALASRRVAAYLRRRIQPSE